MAEKKKHIRPGMVLINLPWRRTALSIMPVLFIMKIGPFVIIMITKPIITVRITYQMHISRRISNTWNLNVAGHYTRGSGYYEEYQQGDELDGEKFADYGLNNLYFGRDSILNGSSYEYFYHDSIDKSDLIRRRWLDNHYYGITWSLRYQQKKIDLVIGGAINKYDRAKHFGEIIWTEFAAQIPKDYEYYQNTSFKTDFNVFAKVAWSPVQKLTIYGDLQYRTIGYKDRGVESHLNPVAIQESFQFLNPKAGISYNLKLGTLYVSYSIAHREPIRDDYIDAAEGEEPNPEMLGNLELGIRRSEDQLRYNFNYYLMNYRNQLVLTGEINDDGAYIRRNAGKSYRTGIELSGGYKPVRIIEFAANLSLSMNKTDYKQPDNEGNIVEYKNTTISFSPEIIGSARVSIFPVKNLEIDWMAKYVGKQYLDNTGNEKLTLNPYLVNDARIACLLSGLGVPDMEFSFMVNNVFNTLYESNGAVYGEVPYYFPQAGINFMVGLIMKF